MNRKFDAIVIGGGMTGGYAAKELCQAGLKVLLLERGPARKHPDSYATTEKEPWDFRFRGLITDRLKKRYPIQSRNHVFTEATAHQFANDLDHPYSTPQEEPFVWFRSYQLGGRSLLWGRQCYRWSDLDFSANQREATGTDWPLRYADIASYYDDVESFVGVSGQKEHLAHLPDGRFLPPMRMNALELLAKDKLAQRWPGRTLTIGRTANLSQPHNGRGACVNRLRCAEGCPHGGYYSALSGAIPAAMATGNLTIRCDTIVERIIYDKASARAKSVRTIDANTREDNEFSADLIFVCAGTLNSTWLLLNSADVAGVGMESNQLGHNLMDHHNCILSANIEAGPDTFPKGRRPTPCYLPRYRNLGAHPDADFKRGYGFEIQTDRDDWRRGLTDNGIGAGWKDGLSDWGPWRVTFVGYGETLPYHDNQVDLDRDRLDKWGLPTLRIRCRFKENELRMNEDMIRSATEMLELLGAKEIETWCQISAPGTIIHEMGTARMGKNRETSVLDPWNRMWEAQNVFVTDGAAMPSSACQNPSITYMALTARACKKALAA